MSTEYYRRPDYFPLACDGADQFHSVFDALNDGVFIIDRGTGRIRQVNQPGCRMFGYDKSGLVGRSIATLSSGIHPYTPAMAADKHNALGLGDQQMFEWQCKTANGVLFWTEVSLRSTDLDGVPTVVVVVSDITRRKRLKAEIAHMAHHDPLTGLSNRLMFTVALETAIPHALSSGRSFAILSLDLDHFKDVNDTRGHDVGDRLVRLAAERLQTGVRPDETVYGLGGDKFAVLLSDSRDPADIGALADRLIAATNRPFMIDGVAVHVGASIGVAFCGSEASDADTLLSHADMALCCAKAEGRQTYRLYCDAMNGDVRSRIALTNELRLAIPGDQLFVVYQPQVAAKGGHIVGVEALVRWQHPSRGVLMPAAFLPIAERSGLVVALDRWVLREACRQGRQWLDAGVAPASICINLSCAQFHEPLELERCVLAVLEETRLPARLLELEITEGTLIGFTSRHTDMIGRLRKAGIRVSLDDFGTGYSSLSYLRRIAFDRIKIAPEFVADLASAATASIVKGILGLARDLGSGVIAEGVETLEQLALLRRWGCPALQGYCFAPPKTADAILPLLSRGAIRPAMDHKESELSWT